MSHHARRNARLDILMTSVPAKLHTKPRPTSLRFPKLLAPNPISTLVKIHSRARAVCPPPRRAHLRRCCCRIETAAAKPACFASALRRRKKKTWSKARTVINAGTIASRARWCGRWSCGWVNGCSPTFFSTDAHCHVGSGNDDLLA